MLLLVQWSCYEGLPDKASDDDKGVFGLKIPFGSVVLAAIVVSVLIVLLIIGLCCHRHYWNKDMMYSSGSSYFNKTTFRGMYRSVYLC